MNRRGFMGAILLAGVAPVVLPYARLMRPRATTIARDYWLIDWPIYDLEKFAKAMYYPEYLIVPIRNMEMARQVLAQQWLDFGDDDR